MARRQIQPSGSSPKFNIVKFRTVMDDIAKEITNTWKNDLRKNKDTGALISSIKWYKENTNSKNESWTISIDRKAVYLDEGTGPHTKEGDGTFIEKIKLWGQRKNLTPKHIYFIAKKIRMYGTKPHPFLYTYKDIIQKYKERLKQAGKEDLVDSIKSFFGDDLKKTIKI